MLAKSLTWVVPELTWLVSEGGVPEAGAVYIALKTGPPGIVDKKGGWPEFTMETRRFWEDVEFHQLLGTRVAL